MKSQYVLPTSCFETSDLLLAATIQAHGMPIALIDWRDGERCVFYFDQSQELQGIIASFWQLTLRLEPHQLFESIKTVKTRIYSSR